MAFLHFLSRPRNIFYFSFCLFFNFIGCYSPSEKAHSEVDYNYNLNYSETLTIEIDSVSTFSPFKLHYLILDDKEYLLAENKNLVTIDVYSLNDNKLEHRLLINDSATLYTKNIHGFWPKSVDSIFVYSYQRISPILLTLDNWKVIGRKKFNVVNPFMQSSFLNHASMTASPSAIIGDEIYFTEFPIGGGDVQSLISSNHSPEVIYNYKKDSVYSSGITWPKVYHQDQWDDLFLYCKAIGDKNTMVYSWEVSHNLMIRSNDSIYQILAKSDFFEPAIVYDPSNFSAEGRNNNRIELNHYMMVLYDKYRQVYYRFAIQGIRAKNSIGRRNTPYDAPFSIIILDQKFNKIGETLFPSNKFLPKDSFVGKKGLYISNHNGKSMQDIDEDIMSFSLFVLTKNEQN